MNVLLVDDEADLRKTLSDFLRGLGHETREAASCAEALAVAKQWAVEAILLDLGLPDGNGLELLPKLKQLRPDSQVLMLTGYSSVKSAVEAMQRGAENFLEKPVDLDVLQALIAKFSEKSQLKNELASLRKMQLDRYQKEYLFLPDESMQRIYEQVDQVADFERVTVLIHGETGTGKEHVARMIHFLSKRAGGPWVELHCGALPESLLESELFGHEAGAFTDARAAKAGLFESAHGGTLFLDEIGEMPLATQVKLLKVLEEKRVRRLGSNHEITLNVHIVAATNRDLSAEVEAGRFRRDLWFRLNAFTILLPPLRQRPNDIPSLAQHFLDEACREFKRPSSVIPRAAVNLLLAHSWSGNVRELKNIIERLVIVQHGPEPAWDQLDALLKENCHCGGKPEPTAKAVSSASASGSIRDLERDAVYKALKACDGNRTLAAEKLGISRKTLFNKLKRWESLGQAYTQSE